MSSIPICQCCQQPIKDNHGTYWAWGQGGLYARGLSKKKIVYAHWGKCSKVVGRSLALESPDENGESWFWGHMPFYKEGGEISNKDRFIYILKSDKYYKIGITKNLDKRIDQLQTGNPHEIYLVCSTFVENTSGFERKLHKEFDQYRISGEWFDLPYEQLEKLIEIIENGDFIADELPLENIVYYAANTRVLWVDQPGVVHSLVVKPYKYQIGYNILLDSQTSGEAPEVTNAGYEELVLEATKEKSTDGYEVPPDELDSGNDDDDDEKIVFSLREILELPTDEANTTPT